MKAILFVTLFGCTVGLVKSDYSNNASIQPSGNKVDATYNVPAAINLSGNVNSSSSGPYKSTEGCDNKSLTEIDEDEDSQDNNVANSSFLFFPRRRRNRWRDRWDDDYWRYHWDDDDYWRRRGHSRWRRHNDNHWRRGHRRG